MTQVQKFNDELTKELSVPAVNKALLATTFKGLDELTMRKAALEGMIRGFTFKDFLEKNVYAIPFKGGYSLITSIDYARKIGMQSGVVGKSAPSFETDSDGKIISCTVTIKRKVDNYVGEYSATVYFNEYYKGGYNGKPSLWDTKPHTMIAKVAEMHALRMACPESLAQAYIEEDMQSEAVPVDMLDDGLRSEIDAITTVEELGKYYKANKGKGKDFDKYVTKRKKELEEATAENVPDATA